VAETIPDAPRSLDCTITEVNDRGVCVDTGDATSFFPWGSVVRRLIREAWTRYRWEGRLRRKP
jgi:hypothetical protein